MKSTNLSIKCKIAVIFTVVSLLFVYVVPINVNANSKGIEPYALIETYTKSADKNLGGEMGSVTCTVKVEYNTQTKTHKLVSVTCTPHFSPSQPLLVMIGSPRSDPEKGKVITNAFVKVIFDFGIWGTSNRWTKDCLIYV